MSLQTIRRDLSIEEGLEHALVHLEGVVGTMTHSFCSTEPWWPQRLTRGTDSQMTPSNLSGTEWWRANQARYPNSRDVDDLEPGFRSRVEDFIASLKQAGATIVVTSTRRNAIRAYLMHYSWQVAYGDIEPSDVPKRAGVDIDWDHGELEKSRKAAQEMVSLFGMAHIAALNSNHIRGRAIDMNVSWKDVLVMTRPAPLLVKIESRPRTGQNRELQEIGATVFEVRKLVSDPPHWSYDGR